MTDSSSAATNKGRGLCATSLALGLLAAVGSVLGGIRLLVPGALAFPTPVWVALGIVVFPSFFAGVPAVITGIVALTTKRPGKAMAVAGLVLGAAGILLWGIAAVVFIAQTPI